MGGAGIHLMKLGDAVVDLPLRSPLGTGDADVEISGLAHDSRRVERGDMFVAWQGDVHDGRRFASEAVARGAAAVMAFGPPSPTAKLPPVPWLEVDDPRSLMGPVAARVYDHPEAELLTVAVTGTNGKSTTTQLIAACLAGTGSASAVVGTLGHFLVELKRGAPDLEPLGSGSTGRTTPEGGDLFRVLREAADSGARSAAIEISSHALDQGRVNGLAPDAAVFTNLSRDHLDYHPSLEAYFRAKRRLFAMLRPGGRAVVNVDDEYGRRLAAELAGKVDVFRFSGAGDPEAEVRVTGAELDFDGIHAEFDTPAGAMTIASSLLGRFHLENLTAAVAAALAVGVPEPVIAAAMAEQAPLAGRLEPIAAGQDFPVLIDYAHTDGGLRAAIRAVRELSGRRIVVVFGCGGDRDRGKRPLMGRAAAELADVTIVTDDNPRSEDPAGIHAAVVAGVERVPGASWEVVPGRRAAIRRAVELAASEPGWTVLIAGKGHEATQEFGDRTVPFRDQEEARAALTRLKRERCGETSAG